MSGFDSSWNSKAWTGASGTLIGFEGDYPETQAYGFVTDPVHSQNVDPNGPSFASQPGPEGSAPPAVLGDEVYGYEYPGQYGWLLDDIHYPSYDQDPGTTGHNSSMGPATRRHLPDQAHEEDVYQEEPKIGYGVNFYGANPLKKDLNAWKSSSTPNFNTGQFPAQAREDVQGWPEPFNATDIAPFRPVDQSTEHIPMRRIAEDDRPVYRYLAVPPNNIQPTGNQWSVQYPSNVPIQNITPVPMMPQAPMDPWITQETATSDTSGSVDVFQGMVLQ
jgi:hypothetical protein